MNERTPRLITLPISHYCEKARWALDRAGVRYREERHVQGIHRLVARRAGGGATVPVLVTGDRVLGIAPGCEVRDEATVFGELDHVAELLADGRPYLCGERFSAGDMTFAALSAPLIVPPEYGTPLPQPELMAPSTAALVTKAREHPAGRHALDMFARHRRERATVAAAP